MFVFILLSLCNRNNCLCLPTLCCVKKIGPGSSMYTINDIMHKIGIRKIKPIKDKIISIPLFTNFSYINSHPVLKAVFTTIYRQRTISSTSPHQKTNHLHLWYFFCKQHRCLWKFLPEPMCCLLPLNYIPYVLLHSTYCND